MSLYSNKEEEKKASDKFDCKKKGSKKIIHERNLLFIKTTLKCIFKMLYTLAGPRLRHVDTLFSKRAMTSVLFNMFSSFYMCNTFLKCDVCLV